MTLRKRIQLLAKYTENPQLADVLGVALEPVTDGVRNASDSLYARVVDVAQVFKADRQDIFDALGVRVSNRRYMTNKPVTIQYEIRRVLPKVRKEVPGLYAVEAAPGEFGDGQFRFRRPLVIDLESKRRDWIQPIQKMFPSAHGLHLLNKLTLARYDGILLLWKNRIYQIIAFNGLPLTSEGVDPFTLQKPVAAFKRRRLFDVVPEADIYFNEDAPPPPPNNPYVSGYALDTLDEMFDEVEEELFDAVDEFRAAEQEVAQKRSYVQNLRYDRQVIRRGPQAEDTASKLEAINERLELAQVELEELVAEQERAEAEVDRLHEKFNALEAAMEYVGETGGESIQNTLDMFFPDTPKSEQQNALLALCGFDGMVANSDEYDVSVELKGSTLIVGLSGPFVEGCVRTVYIDEVSRRLRVYNKFLRLEDSAPSGLGSRILYSQALACQEFGVEQLSCEAASGKDFQGYYVWARLGYNSPLMYKEISNPKFGSSINEGVIDEMFEIGILHKSLIPKPYTALTMHDLMLTAEGRDFWREYGKSWLAEFDLDPKQDGSPSDCFYILEEYIRQKEDRQGSMSKWAFGESWFGEAEELRLDSEDESILDEVWRRFLRRRLRRR